MIEPRDHIRKQIELPAKERLHVEMAMGQQYLPCCDAALVLIRVERQQCFDILRNGDAESQIFKCMV